MQKIFCSEHDLTSPDGKIIQLKNFSSSLTQVTVKISNISKFFLGFSIDKNLISFNLKSSLAQIGLDTTLLSLEIDSHTLSAEIQLNIHALGPLAERFLSSLEKGTFVGKLFAADDRRKVLTPYYLERMLKNKDDEDCPLLKLGELENSFSIEKVNAQAVAFVSLDPYPISYDEKIFDFIPLIHKALQKNMSIRNLLDLYRINSNSYDIPTFLNILLLKTTPLYVRTVFAKVVHSLLPKGVFHTSADILQPDTKHSGNIYEIYGENFFTVNTIPLEFYTLEPHKEHVFFSDRDSLQETLENKHNLLTIFRSSPGEEDHEKTATFITKGSLIKSLSPEDWISFPIDNNLYCNVLDPIEQKEAMKKYIETQPCYYFLQAMEKGFITSQGVLFTRYFPSVLLKGMLLSHHVQKYLKQIYFRFPSCKHGIFFSERDRAMLVDLDCFGISVFWVEKDNVLQYVRRNKKNVGTFVPIDKVDDFKKACFFGLYGSSLTSNNLEHELRKLFLGLKEMKNKFSLSFFNKETPLALITGGGPGSMAMGNKIARELNILSCANIVDFEVVSPKYSLPPQPVNPFIDVKMTYRRDSLIERQAEFYLDFPIFVYGGIGTDFEFALENLSLKIELKNINPVLLFGLPNYWKEKITALYKNNVKNQTIKGSEWVSNCFFCVENASEALYVYKKFFSGSLHIGASFPPAEEGFVTISKSRK